MFEPYKFGREYRNAHLSKVDQSDENIEKIVSWFKSPKNMLYYTGKVGNGKTYLCAAFLNHLLDSKILQVKVYSEQYLFSELKMCMDIPAWEPLYRIKKICDVDYLILDDMGSSKMTEWQKEMLFYIVDLRYSSCLPTLITSNLSYKEIRETFHERFASRLYCKKNTIMQTDHEDRRQTFAPDAED